MKREIATLVFFALIIWPLSAVTNGGAAEGKENTEKKESTKKKELTSQEIAENPSLFKGKWTANKIAEITEDKYDGDTMKSKITMVLINSKGKKRTRVMKSYRKDFGENLKDKRLATIFVEPADIRNTAFLNYEYDDDDVEEESWLYLPALRKVKRLSASDKSDAFMGSDFSYNDFKTNHREYWNYKMISKSAVIDGEDCWVIEGHPKVGKEKKVRDETGCLKIKLWIQKKTFTKVRGQFWLIKGGRVKLFKATDIKKINGVWFAMNQKMVTTKKGRVEHSTILKYSDVVYNEEISSDFLTPHGIESGR